MQPRQCLFMRHEWLKIHTKKRERCRQFCCVAVGVPGSVLRPDVQARRSLASVSGEACCRSSVFSNSRRVFRCVSSLMRALSPFTSSRTANIRWLFTNSCISPSATHDLYHSAKYSSKNRSTLCPKKWPILQYLKSSTKSISMKYSTQFPAYSWAGYWQNGCCPVGWLVSKSRVCQSVCPRAAERR